MLPRRRYGLVSHRESEKPAGKHRKNIGREDRGALQRVSSAVELRTQYEVHRSQPGDRTNLQVSLSGYYTIAMKELRQALSSTGSRAQNLRLKLRR